MLSKFIPWKFKTSWRSGNLMSSVLGSLRSGQLMVILASLGSVIGMPLTKIGNCALAEPVKLILGVVLLAATGPAICETFTLAVLMSNLPWAAELSAQAG